MELATIFAAYLSKHHSEPKGLVRFFWCPECPSEEEVTGTLMNCPTCNTPYLFARIEDGEAHLSTIKFKVNTERNSDDPPNKGN